MNRLIKIYTFGNEFVQNDEIAKVLAKKIKKYKNFEFIIAENPAEILAEKDEIWILDVAKGISNTTLVRNPKNLELSTSLTCHDLDLGFYLKLLTETGKITSVNIIALPWGETHLGKLEKEVLTILDDSIPINPFLYTFG